MITAPASEILGCAPRAVDAFSAALAAHRAPSSNTGSIRSERGSAESESQGSSAFVDFLKFTLRGMRKAVERAWQLDARQAPAELRKLRDALGITAAGDWDITHPEARGAALLLDSLEEGPPSRSFEPLAQTALDRGLAVIGRMFVMQHAPALVFGELTGRGRDGYKDHLCIYTHLGENCGFVAVGGNGDTIHVNLTGQACQRIEMLALADALDGVDHKIGRIDAAFDDFTGEFGSPRDCARRYEDGGYTPERGIRSNKVRFFDDLGTDGGCTFQLGDRSSRMFRCYEKDKQLGRADGTRVRYEVQYMGAAFDLTTDNLRNPGRLLLQYPDLDHLPIITGGDAVMRVRRDAEICLDKWVEWVRNVCGPALALLSEPLGAECAVRLIENGTTPRRLRKLANTRRELCDQLADNLLDSRKHAPIASTPFYTSAEQRERLK